jgi:colanic acid/amylovoran biosynthesis glycosyltransferase
LRTVLIYKDELLPMSETFIQTQTSALKRYTPQFVGVFPAKKSLPMPGTPIVALPATKGTFGKLRRILYYQTGAAPRFFQDLRKTKADIIHAHFASSGKNAVRLAEFLKIPLVVTLHGHDVTVKRNYRAEYSKLWKRASVFLCVSESIRGKAIEAGFPPSKLRVLFNGIIPEQNAVAADKKDSNLILFVGRLVEKKGCTYLLQAMSKVKEVCPGARLVMIGDGPLRDELTAEAKALNVPCTFLGAQPSDVVRANQAQASILCVPSVTAESGDAEGLPTVILEAMTAGTTVVASRHAGAPEAIEDGETGLLVDERDSEGLANALIRALQDSALRDRFRDFGPKLVREKFDAQRQAAMLEDIYDEATAQAK